MVHCTKRGPRKKKRAGVEERSVERYNHIRRVLAYLTKILPHERGKRNEEKFSAAARMLVERRVLLGMVHFPSNSPEDRRGIDFSLLPNPDHFHGFDGMVSFDVKSSFTGVRKHHGNGIAFLVRVDENLESIANRICQAIVTYVQEFTNTKKNHKHD